MANAVSLRAVADEMDFVGHETRAFLNRQTGELYSTTDELISKADDEDAEDEDFLDWELEIVVKLWEILGSDDWLTVPTRDTHDDYRIMESFCLERGEDDLRHELLEAIRGRGPFRWFRHVIEQRGIKEAWYAFRREALEAEAAEWLESHGIAYEA
jgi:hypothetical protein